MSDFKFENCSFKPQYGHRVEVQSHNFVIFRNFINLSFSYMTFVIKEKFERSTSQNSIFDLEGLNFIIERNTVFTSGNLAQQQYEKLQFILKNYLLKDIKLLESLYYRKPSLNYLQMQTTDFKTSKCNYMTPLHIAISSKNTRMINLLLFYMSKIPFGGD